MYTIFFTKFYSASVHGKHRIYDQTIHNYNIKILKAHHSFKIDKGITQPDPIQYFKSNCSSLSGFKITAGVCQFANSIVARKEPDGDWTAGNKDQPIAEVIHEHAQPENALNNIA
ncbi:hypothetical protein COLO4_32669 [Corchorus olitorius]|uniref:Uncharacterized protein n=1 Tax=Corchorus olitorius TaxID=93759 RepID=A0A1R3GYL0_9ROSI|nr:hypothetical protein COLO4_32669 [Corchorus olitorius]